MKVTIKDKAGLQAHATDSENAASVYVNNISATERQFEIKVSDSYTSAIDKFQERMNSISNLLHEEFPHTLERYGESILTYVADVDGAGFAGSQVIKTKDDDIEKIKTWLTSTTSKQFETISTDFEEAFKTAKEALALEPQSYELSDNPTNDTIKTEIDSKLKTLAEARTNTHESLNSALTSFQSNLQEVTGILVGVNAAIRNAANIGTLSFTEVLTMVKNGQLTAGNMQLINSIQGTNDVTVLRILLNEGEDKEKFFTELGNVKSKEVSSSMMDLVYHRVHQEYEGAANGIASNANNMRTYIYTIAGQEKDDAKDYFEKLVMAGDRFAGVLSTGARAMMPVAPDTDAGPEAWKQYEEARSAAIAKYPGIEQQMARAGVLTSLFESLVVAEVGKETFKAGLYELYDMDSTNSISELQFHENGFTYNLKTRTIKNRERGEVEVSDENIGSYSYTNFDKVAKAERIDNIRKIREKRAEAMNDFSQEVIAMVAGKAVPGGDTLVELASSFIEMDKKPGETLNRLDLSGQSLFGDAYSKYGGDYVGNYATIVSHIDNLKALDVEESLAKKSALDGFFDAGGRKMDGEKIGYVKSDMTYDLQAIMARDDLEKNGLRVYHYDSVEDNPETCDVNEKIAAVRKYEDYMQTHRSELNLSSYESYEFLMGQDHYSVEEFKINELEKDLQKITNDEQLFFKKEEYDKWLQGIHGLGGLPN